MAELKKISSLFDKYKKTLVAPESSVVGVFVDVVQDLLGVECQKGQVRYNPTTRVLSFLGGGVLRGECKTHEAEILAHLRGRLGDKNAPRHIL
jgi:hypothetical protein